MPILPNNKAYYLLKIFIVQRRILSFSLFGFFFIVFLNWSCSKLDTTDIGSDLIPAVDNVHTFADTLNIITTQGIFDDSTIITRTNDHVLGTISNDPVWGTTKANIYLQLKPTFYPFHYGNVTDTIDASLDPRTHFDSVVLCLNYKGFYGDSTVPQQVSVYEIPSFGNGIWDSVYQDKNIKWKPNILGQMLGSATIDVRTLANQMVYHNSRKDSVKNQIRIALSASSNFVNHILHNYKFDTLSNGIYAKDTLFRLFHDGLAIVSNTGNGLIYSGFSDTTTKLEIHYVRKVSGVYDTTYSSFVLSTAFLSLSNLPSATGNYVARTRPSWPNAGASEIYLQTTPGTYANLSIPSLSGLSNRIIHRAELIVDQIPGDPNDKIFVAPNYLYLDLLDSPNTSVWKPLYFDLNPSIQYDPDFTTTSVYYPGNIDLAYFGGIAKDKVDPLTGLIARTYRLNLTRYIQQMVTKHTPNYKMRLFAPYAFSYPQYSNAVIDYYNALAFGRVKVGGGSNPNYRMKMRIIYSKL